MNTLNIYRRRPCHKFNQSIVIDSKIHVKGL